jgi:hypothetical protein
MAGNDDGGGGGDDDTYKLVHGILMGSAWLVLAPIAIGASLIRRISPATCCLNQNGFWFQIHFYCQILVVVFTVAGFLVIWWGGDDGGGGDDRIRFLKDYWENPSDEKDNDDGHDDNDNEDYGNDDSDNDEILLFPAFGWTEDNAEENIHPKIGISILVLVLFQAFLGFIRPHVHPPAPPSSPPPAASSSSKVRSTTTFSSSTEQNGTDDNYIGSSAIAVMDATKSPDLLSGDNNNINNNHNNEPTAPGDNYDDDDVDHTIQHPPTKTMIRVIWEWCHRCLGLTLLGISWLQCIIGIRIFRS